MKNNHHAVFFDLDGTLLDTAPDLHHAMEATLKDIGRDSVQFDIFRTYVHAGTNGMLTGSLNLIAGHQGDSELAKIRPLFLHHYRQRLHEDTDYFPGIPALLTHLDQYHLPWGIITNKPTFLTEPLLTAFDLIRRCQCIICGDTLSRAKPHPDPLLHACRLTEIEPQRAIYIGDTAGDITAAKAAGMTAVGVLYGYHGPNSQPTTWGADYLVDNPQQILDMLL